MILEKTCSKISSNKNKNAEILFFAAVRRSPTITDVGTLNFGALWSFMVLESLTFLLINLYE